jgi:hypothetical protein
MVEKSIKIFFGSSIVEFQRERISIELFIRRISALLEKQCKIRLEPLFCEAFDDALFLTRKQDEYNEKLRDSDLSFFVFYTRAGQFTVEEFEEAIRALRKHGKPKIYVFFKETTADKAIDQSLKDFRRQLEEKHKYYGGHFSNVNTVKFRILQALTLLSEGRINLRVEAGKCWIDGVEIREKDLSLGKVTEFANNATLQNMKKELEEVSLKCHAVKAQDVVGKLDDQAREEDTQLLAKRQSLADNIEEIERQIFEMSLGISRDIVRDEMTARQRAAYALFEKGDYKGCLHILDPAGPDDE